MISYHLLRKSLQPAETSSSHLFSFAVRSAVNGFVGHDDYVRSAASAELAPPTDSQLSRHVQLLLACDVNPLAELVQSAGNADQFAERWNGINSKVSLGVATTVDGATLDANRRSQQGADTALRQRVMYTFIEHLKPKGVEVARQPATERLHGVAREVSSAMADLVEVLREQPSAELSDCANALRCSRRTLQRQLTACGITFGQVRQAARICLSTDMLYTSRASLTEVALISGFYDSAHFSRSMKQSCCLSPTEYRALCRPC